MLRQKGFYLVTFVYLVVVATMLPFRQLGFQDDFAYYRTVENLLNTGHLKVSEWAATTLVFQSYWGAVFSTIFGFSFKTLHLSVVVLFYFGLIAFYLILREIKVSEFKSVVATIFLLAFPSTLRQAFTFMTDVPYLSLMLISIYFGVRAIKTGRTKNVLISALVGMLAFLNRQIGICIPAALLLAFILRSVYEKKVLFKPILIIISFSLLIYGTYSYWLNLGDNKTLGQYLYLDADFQYLKMYMLPIGLHRLRPTSEIYEEAVYRAGYYIQYFLVIIFPLMFVFKNKEYRKILRLIIKSFRQIIFPFIFLGFLYWRVFLRSDFSGHWDLLIFRPPEILSAFSSVGMNLWKNIWNAALIIFFPIWLSMVGIGIKKFADLFTVATPISKIKKTVYSLFFCLVSLAIAFYFLIRGYSLFGRAFSASSFFIWFVLVSANTLFIFLVKNRFKRSGNIVGTSLTLFFFFLFIFHLVVNLVTHFTWWESYILPFTPLVVIGFLFLFKDREFGQLKSTLVVGLILIFSLSSAKIDYDQQGLLWEEAEKAVASGIVDPREVGIINWAWYPYFFQEKSYDEALVRVGGDKKKIGNVHTWWEDYEYRAKDWNTKLIFVSGPCEGRSSWKLVQKIEARSIFRDIRYCVYLKTDF